MFEDASFTFAPDGTLFGPTRGDVNIVTVYFTATMSDGIGFKESRAEFFPLVSFNPSGNSPPLLKAGMRAKSRNEIYGQRLAPTALEKVSSPPVKAGESNLH